MKGFIEVTEHYQQKKFLLPVNRICYIKERNDSCAVINFVMSVENDGQFHFFEKISDIVTVETYIKVITKIKRAL